jgi:aryl-alcohol dehydrogenase-like predicted oxidoreductase
MNGGRLSSVFLGTQQVARIGFGAMQIERLTSQPADAVKLLRRAIDLGVDHIDTAQFYGNGFANEVIRQVLADGRPFVVATKVGADPDPGKKFPIKPAQRPEQLRASVDDNLRSLGLEQLPVVNLRRLDIPPGLVAEGDQIVDIDDQLALLIALRDEGKIGAIGVGSASRVRLERAIPAGIVCVQSAYSPLSRQYEDMLELCVAHGIAWVPFFPLGGARFPGWPKVTEHPKVIEIAAAMGATPSQLGLAWLLARSPNILLIPGTTNPAHLEENVASASLSLSVAILAELDALGAERREPLPGKVE